MVINKLYDVGKIDDAIKNEFMDTVFEPSKPLTRNLMLKVMYEFLYNY